MAADATTAAVHPHPLFARTSQAGIRDRPPDHLLVAAFDLPAGDAAATRSALERLRDLVHAELRSHLDVTDEAAQEVPSPETGELGFTDGYDRFRLTVTLGLGQGTYDKLGITAGRPADIRPIDWAALHDTDKGPVVAANGDFCVQICSDSVYINEHVLRRVQFKLPDLSLVWVLQGHQRHNPRRGHLRAEDARALTGFLDGTANLDLGDPTQARLVFVDPADRGDLPPKQPPTAPNDPNPYAPGRPQPQFPPDLHDPPGPEPDVCKYGSYMVVRGSVIDTPPWDSRSLGDQEHTVGRHKVDGTGLDGSVPPAAPNFATDIDGNVTPVDAHIRKANPRGPGDELRRIFRRGYPLVESTVNGLQRGLVFICFGRTITTQFEFITRAWTTNNDFPHPGAGQDRLRASETQVLAGGYFFAVPLTNKRQPWSWLIPEA